jgi:hypothetical protein
MVRSDATLKTPSGPELAATEGEKATERVACGATVVITLADAHDQIDLAAKQELLRQMEQQARPENEELVRHKAHPANYPPSIDIRSSSKNET